MAGPLSFDRSEIIRALNVYHKPGDVVELRIPKAGRARTISGYFHGFELLADSVVGLSDDRDVNGAGGVYITLNQIDERLLSRSQNHYKRYAETTTSDGDIIRLSWLPIDLDPVRPTGISSSDEEHKAALDKALEVRDWLIGRGWPVGAFVLGDSGNGGHLPVKIDLEPSDSGLVERCLKAIDFIFSDEAVKVDTTTHNPARIWKLPGTAARKGDPSEDRPHRLARLLEVPEVLETVPRELLEDLAGLLPKDEPARSYQRGGDDFDPARYAEDHGLKVYKVKTWNGGPLVELEECPFNGDHKGTARIGRLPSGARYFGCFHNGCKGNDWRALRDLLEPDRDRRERATVTDEGGRAPVLGLRDICNVRLVNKGKPGEREDLTFSPDKAAAAVLEIFEIITTPDKRIWVYQDGIFEPTGEHVVEALLDEVAGDVANIKMRNETLARVRLRTRQEYDVFDSDPCLFCVDNGVLDMRTGQFSDHSPKYRRTRKAPVIYDPSAKMVELQKFLDTALDESGQKTLLDILSAKTTGLTFEYFSPWIGRGQNGKTKTEEMIKGFWGEDQVTEVEVSSLSQNKFDMVQLRGKSFVINSEVAGGRSEIRWIKVISGGGRVTADQKGREHITFRPHCFIIFDCNDPPRFDDNSHGFGRRIAPIYWRYSFVDDPKESYERLRDPDILAKITTPRELSGLLNVLIERAPEVIKTRTIYRAGKGDEIASKYDIQANHRELFWDWFVESDPDEHISSSWLYGAYKEFCELEGVTPARDRAFGDRGRYLKFKKGKAYDDNGGRVNVWVNCSFNVDSWNEYLQRYQGTGIGPASDRQESLSRPTGPSIPSISPIEDKKKKSSKDVSIEGNRGDFAGPAGPAGPVSDSVGQGGPAKPDKADRQSSEEGEDEPAPSDEIKAEALGIVAGLNGRAVTFGNVEAYLETKSGSFAPPKAVKRVLNVLGALGWTTGKDGALSPPSSEVRA